MHDRPTTDPRVVMLDAAEVSWAGFRERLTGLTDDEYLWEPVPGCWSVRAQVDGPAIVEGANDRDADPAPVTTIAWRLWHIGPDCLDSYAERVFGSTGAVLQGDRWHLNADDALADLDAAWANWWTGLTSRAADGWWWPIGDGFGPYAQHSLHDLAAHAIREVTHHGAEVALLRDLWRARSGS